MFSNQELLPALGWGTCRLPPHNMHHVPKIRLADGARATSFTLFFELGFLFLRSTLDKIHLLFRAVSFYQFFCALWLVVETGVLKCLTILTECLGRHVLTYLSEDCHSCYCWLKRKPIWRLQKMLRRLLGSIRVGGNSIMIKQWYLLTCMSTNRHDLPSINTNLSFVAPSVWTFLVT